jgi:hypothetical protein
VLVRHALEATPPVRGCVLSHRCHHHVSRPLHPPNQRPPPRARPPPLLPAPSAAFPCLDARFGGSRVYGAGDSLLVTDNCGSAGPRLAPAGDGS